MNKLTKVGCSALCGSLAAIASANAGALDVTGSSTITWSSNQGDVTGNPIGMNSGITFSGSGELDTGATYTLTLTGTDKAGYSGGSVVMDTFMGQFRLGHADGGSGIDAFDDKMPTAWEETWGTSLGTGVDLISGVGASTNVQYKTPSWGNTYLAVAWAPQNAGGTANDKGVVGHVNSYKQGGFDVMLNLGLGGDGVLGGLNIFVGGSETERDDNQASSNDVEGKHEEVVVGATYAYGPVTIGAQTTGEFTGNQVQSEVEYYHNTTWGVSFNVNDDLSLSYAELRSKKGFVGKSHSGDNNTGTVWINDRVDMDVESFQLAYSMGGASVKIAQTDMSGQTYTSGSTQDKEATTIALSLAF